ncbi:hypothetical protein ACOMHN_002344 [Nucella lapillus]
MNPGEDSLTLIIEDEPVRMIIDSGASCNVINTATATKLKRQGLEFEKCHRVIHPYRSKPIIAKQSLTAEIKVAGRKPTTAEFLVIQGNQPPILGKQTATTLGVLHIGPDIPVKVNHIQQSDLDRYPGITEGIGKLKNMNVIIHIDGNVTPVARKHSRVTLHLRGKVEKELERLVKEDVIEKISGPTEWVSRIVVVPKPKSDDIRLCVDMREANKAVLRTRHVTPTIEELVADLNGATVFSKIDLRSAYNQLELNPKSRHITTFSTHAGLYQYKRLCFGISSAAEIFQHTIQTVIEGIHGSRNLSDDIIVFGKDTEDHDRALHETLKHIHEAGLTVNGGKCKFRQNQVEFYGFIFTADGVKPNPEKVKSLKEAKAPQNSSELRSFLGMAQYSARFIDGFATITEPLRKLT